MFWRSMFVLLSFFLAIVLSVFRFTDYDYHFDMFKLSAYIYQIQSINVLL